MRILETAKHPGGELGDTLAVPRHVESITHILSSSKLTPHKSDKERRKKAHSKVHDALRSYVGNGYRKMNAALRKSNGKKHALGGAKLSELTKHPLSRAHHLYRGVSLEAGVHKLKKGDTFTDHGFTSATTSGNLARSWREHDGVNVKTGKASHSYHSVVAHIHAPKGTKGHEYGGHENEVILHHGTKFKVLGHSVHVKKGFLGRNHYTHVVHMKVIK